MLDLLGELGPVLLVLEDVPWADRSTRDFLAFLAGRVSRRSVNGSVTVKGTDAAGATTLTCDSGAVDWRASTG